MRTPRGRMLSEKGYKYLGLTPKQGAQIDWLGEEETG